MSHFSHFSSLKIFLSSFLIEFAIFSCDRVERDSLDNVPVTPRKCAVSQFSFVLMRLPLGRRLIFRRSEKPSRIPLSRVFENRREWCAKLKSSGSLFRASLWTLSIYSTIIVMLIVLLLIFIGHFPRFLRHSLNERFSNTIMHLYNIKYNFSSDFRWVYSTWYVGTHYCEAINFVSSRHEIVCEYYIL